MLEEWSAHFISPEKYVTLASMLYVCTSQVRPRMEYYYHIWAGAVQPSVPSHDRISKMPTWPCQCGIFRYPATLNPNTKRRQPFTALGKLSLKKIRLPESIYA